MAITRKNVIICRRNIVLNFAFLFSAIFRKLSDEISRRCPPLATGLLQPRGGRARRHFQTLGFRRRGQGGRPPGSPSIGTPIALVSLITDHPRKTFHF